TPPSAVLAYVPTSHHRRSVSPAEAVYRRGPWLEYGTVRETVCQTVGGWVHQIRRNRLRDAPAERPEIQPAGEHEPSDQSGPRRGRIAGNALVEGVPTVGGTV